MELSLALSHALSSPAASRFGHTCSLIHAHDSAWVVELAVVLFGVKRRNEGDLDEQPSDEVYTATNSISVLDLDGQRWFVPKTNEGPSPSLLMCRHDR